MGKSNSKPFSLNSQFKQAIIIGDHRVLRAMISQFPFLKEKPVDDDLRTPLMFACLSESMVSVKLLIEVYQVNINERDYYGLTALLHCVIRNGEHSLEIAEFLCKSGADISQKTDSGVTASSLASLNNNHRLKTMLDYYAKYGKWALHPFQRRKLILFIYSKSKFRVLPMNIIREICEFM